MKKFSKEAEELLSAMELYEIKAGSGGDKLQPATEEEEACVVCSTCVGCSSSCTTCTSRFMDVIIA